MTNQYSFSEDYPFTTSSIKEYYRNLDLSPKAVICLSDALKKGDLGAIKSLFQALNKKQKEALLQMEFDDSTPESKFFYNEGNPIDLATQLGFTEIADFLTSQKNAIHETY